MNKVPMVSVIVPVYKVPHQYLHKCIISILNQTLQSLELILIDDGSPDDCGKICDGYAEQDNRVVVIHKKNEGLSAARTTGAKAATGQYITFVDGDDWIEPETLEIASQQAMQMNAEIVCWGTIKDFGCKQELYEYADNFIDGKLYVGRECRCFQEMIFHYNAQIATAYSKLIKKAFVEQHGLYHNAELKQGAEGLEFCFRLFGAAQQILFLNQHWYHYIYNKNSISAMSTETNNVMILKCFETIESQLKETEEKDRLYPWFYNRLIYVIITTAISGYFHPENSLSYRIKKQKYKEYLAHPLLQKCLLCENISGLSKQHSVVLWLIRHKQYWALFVLGVIRKQQKSRFSVR